MHELSVTQSIVNIVSDEAEKAGAVRVTAVDIVIGKCTCLVPQIVQDYFDLLSEGTPAEKARLRIKRLPGVVRCNACGNTGEIKDFRTICPECGSRDTELVQGKEFYIDSIEIEDDSDEKESHNDENGLYSPGGKYREEYHVKNDKGC